MSDKAPTAKAKQLAKQKRRRAAMRNRIITAAVALVLICASFFIGRSVGIDSTRFHGDILLVNEANPLAADYVPDDLVCLYEQRHSFRLMSSDIYVTRETYEAMEQMFAAAEADGMNGYTITSGYRTYSEQAQLYAESEAGKALRAGASEHQTGLCFDVTIADSSEGFESTPQYAWLSKNAHKYGFIQRYPTDKSDVTGVSYEPWHYRYVGTEAAQLIYESGLSLEEFIEKNK